jgi:hypothetical protein
MGFKDATTPWKIFYIASALFLLTIIIVGICLAFLLKSPGATVASAYIYCPDYNQSSDSGLTCAAQADCNAANLTDCRDPSRGIAFRVTFNVNNPSISSCTMQAEIDVYDDSRSPGTGAYLIATTYFLPGHLVPNKGSLGKNSKGLYVAELKLKDSGVVGDAGSQTTYANAIPLIATQMRRSCCTPTCPVSPPGSPDYSDSCIPQYGTLRIRIKGKMHYDCLINPKVNFEQVIPFNLRPIG